MDFKVRARNTITITSADYEAWRLLKLQHPLSTGDSAWEIIEAGNEIIRLAEKVKAERSAAAMQSS